MTIITQDQIREDFMTLWNMLSDRTVETEILQKAFRDLLSQIVRYQSQKETQADKDRMWSLIETMQIQYDACLGFRAAKDIIDIVEQNHY